MDLPAIQLEDYELIDSGDGRRLERFGPYSFDRPAPNAIWPKARPAEWSSADGIYTRAAGGKGAWDWTNKTTATWLARIDDLTLELKPTGFGHVGLFPEHTCHWPWLEQMIGSRESTSILHLFAYTGATSLKAAAAGASVCHVDAVRDINDWARRNQELSGLSEAPIRWIAEDAMKFAAREQRRERRYDAIILDPPSFGRGPKGERWVLDEQLPELMDTLLSLMSEAPLFILFTGHNPGFSPPVMANMLRPWKTRFGGAIESGTTIISGSTNDLVLPSGFFARWTA